MPETLDAESATRLSTSIHSTVTDYKFEHGRRYHAYDEEKYPLPNDDDEINRLGGYCLQLSHSASTPD